jgi:hypothetical protein
MRIKFRADNDLNRDIVRGVLRACPEIDFEAGPLHGLTDLEVLELTAGEERVLVSHDLSTIPNLYFSLLCQADLPGVILIPQRFTIAVAIERLQRICVITEAENWRNQLRYLSSIGDES